MVARILAAVAVVLIAAALVVLGWPQVFGLQRLPVVAQVVALRGLLVAIAAVVAVGVLLIAIAARRARRLAASVLVLVLVFCGVNAAVLGLRGAGGEAPDAQGAPPETVVVLSWNTLGDAPGVERIAQLAVETGADIVSLPETSNTTGIAIAEAMGAQGRPMHAHNYRTDTYAKAQTTALLVSVDLGDYELDQSLGSTPVLPSGIWRPEDGEGPVIVAAHPVAPIPGRMQQWRDGLDWLAARCTQEGDDVIVAGDFNSTLDHWDGLGHDGGVLGPCRDAARQAGAAAVGTWPTDLPTLLGAPIDHVIAGPAWRATSFQVITDDDETSGSDHRPVVATLERMDG